MLKPIFVHGPHPIPQHGVAWGWPQWRWPGGPWAGGSGPCNGATVQQFSSGPWTHGPWKFEKKSRKLFIPKGPKHRFGRKL